MVSITIYIYIYMYTYMCVYIYIYICFVYMCTYVYIYICVRIKCVCIYTNLSLSIYIYIHIHIYTYMLYAMQCAHVPHHAILYHVVFVALPNRTLGMPPRALGGPTAPGRSLRKESVVPHVILRTATQPFDRCHCRLQTTGTIEALSTSDY